MYGFQFIIIGTLTKSDEKRFNVNMYKDYLQKVKVLKNEKFR